MKIRLLVFCLLLAGCAEIKTNQVSQQNSTTVINQTNSTTVINNTSLPASTSAPAVPGTPSVPTITPAPGVPAGNVSADAALKAEVAAILTRLSPGIQEKAAVSALTRTHALQLSQNAKDTEFRLQAQYQPVSPSALQILMMRQGVFGSDNLLNAYFSDTNRASLLSRLEKQVSESLGSVPFTHYGLEVLNREGNSFVSLVLLTEIISLQGLQLNYNGPVELNLSGRMLSSRYQNPQGLITRPDGQVETLPVVRNGNDFTLPLKLSQSGYYSFEINVTGPLGPQPATNFVVAVGVPYPAPDTRPDPSPTPLPALNQLRNQMLTLVNQDRQSMGVGALQLEDRLDQAAQYHSDEMVDEGYIGHISPLIGTPQQQVARAGVSEPVAQNIAISRSLENAQQELMSSPGHRQTLIIPDWTHVGFGFRQAPDGFLYVTQKFIRRRVALDALPAKAALNSVLQVKGRSLESGRYLGVFLDGQIQGEPIELSGDLSFQVPVPLKTSGNHQLRVGLSKPPVGNSLEFTFTNLWDFQVE
jgi:uncharacterized protein YkwD